MKRYLGILMALILVLALPVGVYGEDATVPSSISLSLDEAYKLLEANNLDIKLLDKKIQMKKDQNEDLVETINDIRGMYSSNNSTNLQYRKTEKLSYRQAVLELDTLNYNRAELLKSLKVSVKQQYIGLLLQKENIDYMKQDIAVMEKKMKEAELRIKLGQTNESEYKSIYSQSLSLQNQLNLLNTQYQTSMINLKKLLGIQLSQQIEIQDHVQPYATLKVDTIQSDIAKSVENDFTVEKLNREIELKKTEIQLVKEYTDAKFSSEYRDLLVELDELETELAYQKRSLEADFLIEYYNLSVLDNNSKLEQLNLEIAKINYDATMAKAKLGMVDSVTEINAGIAYNRQKNSAKSAMYNYVMAVEQFNQNLTVNE